MASAQKQSANVDLFDAYFGRADLDRDGRISGNEAVAFFQGSGLPKQVLAQEKKMELNRAVVKMEQEGDANAHFRGWQPGIQEGAADWDEDWDKFEDKGFAFVEELTLDVLNVLAPSKQKSSSVQKEKALPVENPTTAASPEVDVKTEKPQSADANPIRTGSSQGGGFSQKSRPFTFDDFVPILGHHSQPSIQDIHRQGTRIVQNFHLTPSLGLIRSEAHKILDFFLNQKHSEDLSLCAAIESLIRVMVFQHLMTSQTLLVLRCHLGHRWTVKLQEETWTPLDLQGHFGSLDSQTPRKNQIFFKSSVPFWTSFDSHNS